MKIYAYLADGFETVEALGVIDILRRAKLDVLTVSVGTSKSVMTSHNIEVKADIMFDESDYTDGDMIFLPGGGNGTKNLLAHEGLKKVILDYYDRDKYIAAICAAPSILGHYGLLKGKKATCFPGFESELIGADYRGDGVVVDGKIITARGMGKTIDLGLKLLEILDGNETAVRIGNAIQYLV